MAVSRVGGSSGKLSGQVGSDIYQIRKNADGTYTQTVYQKGQRVETTFTPRLQAQRMCIGMVESLMKQLKPVVGISYQSGRNKTASANAFSATNVRLVLRDAQEHWYANNVFVFPYFRRGYPDFSDIGGPYMMSSGTLTYNIYNELLVDDFPRRLWDGYQNDHFQLYGLKFDCRLGIETVDQWRKRHRTTVMDAIVWVGFREWVVWDDPDEDPDPYYKHDYIIASFNSKIPSNTILTRQVVQDLFVFKSDMNVEIRFRKDNTAFCIGKSCDIDNLDEQFYYHAGFSISYLSGKKQISSSYYSATSGITDRPYVTNQQPSMVFGSWMGEPTVRPYPTPF